MHLAEEESLLSVAVPIKHVVTTKHRSSDKYYNNL